MKNFAAFALALSAAVTAAPVNKPFSIGLTVPGHGILYMKSDASVTPNLSEAAKCTINEKTQMECGAGLINAGPYDMTILNGATKAHPATVTEGFFVDDKDGLHWESDKFAFAKKIGNKASWAIKTKGDSYEVYAQLGCTADMGSFHTEHVEAMTDGTAKVYWV